MTMLRFVLLLLAVGVALGSVSSCGNECEDCGRIIPDAPDLVGAGWTAFESGDFDEAGTRFESAIARDPADNEAHNGLGWANLRRGLLDEAAANFDVALANGFSGADANAGRTIALRDLQPADYQGSIDAAVAALAIDGAFVFVHDTNLDWMDLRLIMAQSYFALGEYGNANAQVGLIGGTMQNPALPTFVTDLLAELDRLGDLVGN